MMPLRRFCVLAFDHDHIQILGNLDGQRIWEGRDYRRTAWYKALPTARTLGNRVKFWLIQDARGYSLETIFARLP